MLLMLGLFACCMYGIDLWSQHNNVQSPTFSHVVHYSVGNHRFIYIHSRVWLFDDPRIRLITRYRDYCWYLTWVKAWPSAMLHITVYHSWDDLAFTQLKHRFQIIDSHIYWTICWIMHGCIGQSSASCHTDHHHTLQLTLMTYYRW